MPKSADLPKRSIRGDELDALRTIHSTTVPKVSDLQALHQALVARKLSDRNISLFFRADEGLSPQGQQFMTGCIRVLDPSNPDLVASIYPLFHSFYLVSKALAKKYALRLMRFPSFFPSFHQALQSCASRLPVDELIAMLACFHDFRFYHYHHPTLRIFAQSLAGHLHAGFTASQIAQVLSLLSDLEHKPSLSIVDAFSARFHALIEQAEPSDVVRMLVAYDTLGFTPLQELHPALLAKVASSLDALELSPLLSLLNATAHGICPYLPTEMLRQGIARVAHLMQTQQLDIEGAHHLLFAVALLQDPTELLTPDLSRALVAQIGNITLAKSEDAWMPYGRLFSSTPSAPLSRLIHLLRLASRPAFLPLLPPLLAVLERSTTVVFQRHQMYGILSALNLLPRELILPHLPTVFSKFNADDIQALSTDELTDLFSLLPNFDEHIPANLTQAVYHTLAKTDRVSPERGILHIKAAMLLNPKRMPPEVLARMLYLFPSVQLNNPVDILKVVDFFADTLQLATDDDVRRAALAHFHQMLCSAMPKLVTHLLIDLLTRLVHLDAVQAKPLTPAMLMDIENLLFQNTNLSKKQISQTEFRTLLANCARLGHTFSSQHLSDLEASFASRITSMSPGNLSSILKSFHRMKHTLSPQTCELCCAKMKSHSESFDSTSLTSFLICGIHLGLPLDNSILDLMAAQAARIAPTFTPKEMAELAAGFATLNYVPVKRRVNKKKI